MRQIANLHRFHVPPSAKAEEERDRASRPGALELLRKARELVERGAVAPGRALSEVWDHRDPYGPIAVASVALDRALPPGSRLDDFATKELLAIFGKAIAALEAAPC